MAFAEMIASFVPVGVPIVGALFAAYHFREALGVAAALGTVIKALGAAVLVVWIMSALGIVSISVDVGALMDLFGSIFGVITSF